MKPFHRAGSLTPARIDWLIAIGVIVIVACLGAARMAPNVIGVYHDDGIYVATAKSLAEGHGYRLINIPGEPPQTKYPILYPLGLALLWRLWPVFPQNAVLLQSLSVLCTGLSLALGYLYLVRVSKFSRLIAGTSAVICATSPWTLYFGTQALSEPLFAVMTMLMFFAAEETSRQSRGRLGDLLRGAVIASPVLVRLVGAPLVGVSMLMLMRQPRRNRWVLLGILATVTPWAAWVSLQSNTVAIAGVAEYYTVRPYSSWWVSDPADITRVLLKNLLWTAEYTSIIPIHALNDSRFVLISLALGTVTWVALCGYWRTRPILVFSMLAYVALVFLWPWPPLRFLVPVCLVSTVCLVAFANAGARVLPHQVRVITILVGAAVVVATNLVALKDDIAVVRRTGYPQPTSEQPVFWRDYQQMFEWIRANTARGDVVASGFDSMLYLYTGRQGIRPYEPRPMALFYGSGSDPVGSPADFVSVLVGQSARFVVQLPMPIFAEESHLNRLIDRVRAERPGCLDERYRNLRDARFVVYEVRFAMCRQ